MNRPRGRTRSLILTGALLGLAAVVPGTVLAAVSFYVARDLRAGEVVQHPTTRVWGTNYIANVSSSATTRLWTYIPSQSRFGGDTGRVYGPLMLRAPTAPSTIWCQNWGSRTIPAARCYGSY